MLIFIKPRRESSIELTYQFAPSTMIAAPGHNLCFLCVFSYFSINLITFQAPPACSASQILRTSVFISYCRNRMTTLWISVFKNIAQALRSPAKLCRFQTLSSASTKPATLPPKFPISHSLLRETWKFWNFPVLPGSACSSGLLFFNRRLCSDLFSLPSRHPGSFPLLLSLPTPPSPPQCFYLLETFLWLHLRHRHTGGRCRAFILLLLVLPVQSATW